MAAEMSNPQPAGPAATFVELWSGSLSSVLSQIAGKHLPFAAQPAAPEFAKISEHDLYLIVTASGAVRGELSFRVPEASAMALAKAFAGERSDTPGLTDDDRSAVEELLRQVAGHVSTAANQIWPALQFHVALSTPPTWPPAGAGWIASGPAAGLQVAIEWQLSAALNSSLDSTQAGETNSAPSTHSDRPPDPSRLGFFMDLELDVTLRFGGCQVLLKDLLQLGPGSVLELDRDIQDAADLLLDGKLIARGDVVMVDGNFGLRVTQIPGAPTTA